MWKKIEIQWKREWFSNLSRFSNTYWNSVENCRQFMDKIAVNSNVILERDWRKVSLALIRSNGGQVWSNFKSFLLCRVCCWNIRDLYNSFSILFIPSNQITITYFLRNRYVLFSIGNSKILKLSLQELFPKIPVVFNCKNVNKYRWIRTQLPVRLEFLKH